MAAGALTAGPPDGPPVVLIHGLGGSHRTWDRVLPLIETRARVYALDLTGSDSIEREADEAAELIEGPAVLVGHSRGALVATAIAERHPALARKLILICAPWAPESRLSAQRPVERGLAIPGIGHLIWMAATDAQRRRALATAFAPGTAVPDRFVADLRATGRRSLVAASRAIDTYLAEASLANRLTASAVPAWLIFGEQDVRVAPPPPDLFTPHSTTVLRGVGHTPPWETPEQIVELIIPSRNDAARAMTAEQHPESRPTTALETR
jgi:pimeloyl-ACP methyl ester carboxylesterase